MANFEKRIEEIRKRVSPPPSIPTPVQKPNGQMAAANDKDEDVDEDVLRILERH